MNVENALGQCRSWPKAGHGGDDLSFVCMEGMTDNMYFLSNFEQRIVMMGNGSLVPPTSNNSPSSWESTFGLGVIIIRKSVAAAVSWNTWMQPIFRMNLNEHV